MYVSERVLHLIPPCLTDERFLHLLTASVSEVLRCLLSFAYIGVWKAHSYISPSLTLRQLCIIGTLPLSSPLGLGNKLPSFSFLRTFLGLPQFPQFFHFLLLLLPNLCTITHLRPEFARIRINNWQKWLCLGVFSLYNMLGQVSTDKSH